MWREIRAVLLSAMSAYGLAACGDSVSDAAVPSPLEPTRAAVGYYCNMIVLDHPGPKGQVFLGGRAMPLWFSSVRDTLAFTMLPEEPKNVAAVYVNDMSRASWDRPEPGTWTNARQAWYVVGSEMTGGMGAPEPVPFASEVAARAFAGRHGGYPVRFDAIPRDAVLGPVADARGPERAGDAPFDRHPHGSSLAAGGAGSLRPHEVPGGKP